MLAKLKQMLINGSNSVAVVDKPIVVFRNQGSSFDDSSNEEVNIDVSDESINVYSDHNCNDSNNENSDHNCNETNNETSDETCNESSNEKINYDEFR